jgi:hypothetical protein
MQLKLIAAGIVALIIAGLTASMFYFKAEAAEQEGAKRLAEAQLAEARVANEAQKVVIERVTALRATDDAALSGLTQAIAKLDEKSDKLTGDIASLERGNADIRTYMATQVPPDLRTVLNRRIGGGVRKQAGSDVKTGTPNGATAKSPIRAVRKAIPRG